MKVTHPSAAMTSRQRLTVLLLLGTGFMLSIDFSILNVALPKVGTAVGLELSQLPWVSAAYALPAAGFALLFGRIADMFGRRRLFLTGIALLAASSILGGLATSAPLLLAARALQGLATAISTPSALALLITAFSNERQRARVLGYNGALLSGGFTVGALVGGFLVGLLSWHWAFLINVPVALVILVVTPFVIPASAATETIRLDVPGALAITSGLLAIIFGITDRNPYVFVVGLGLMIAFWLIEARVKEPLIAIGMLSRPAIKWGNIAGLTVFGMESALVFIMTLYLQDVLHFSPLATGLVFGVPGLAAVVAGIVAGRFIARYGARTVLCTGMMVQTGLTAPLALLGASEAWLALLVPALFIGFFGHITAIVACMVTATSDVRDAEQGLATGLISMTQQIAATIGIPILGAVVATQRTLLDGVHLAIAVNVLLTVTATGWCWIGLRDQQQLAPGKAHATALTAS